jgi:amino acid adenylation domain-containing protein
MRKVQWRWALRSKAFENAAQISTINAPEKRSMLARLTDSIPARIAGLAAQTPSRIAITDDAGPLTHGELERRSDALAARLRDAGVRQDTCVGVFLDRSAGFIVAALAVMKSGGAYVPLDSASPEDRVAAILADAGAVALVTDACKARRVPAGSWRVLAVDSGDDASAPFTPLDLDPDSLAYVIYTSGSTGQPKGVEITHANLCNLVDWHRRAFAVTAADHASQVAGLGFDAAVWEIWPYLSAGATLHVVDEITRKSSEALFDWFVAEQITIGFVPTALAEQLIRKAWPETTALRFLLTGGDALHNRPTPELPFAVVNNYGPTECTVVATSGVVTPEGHASGQPSIGRPIAGATALVLDESLDPVPPGEAGELFLGGALVGRGYRNQPELTSRCFITHRTASGDVLRLYRTGDRVALLENGEIAFLGRLDDMVKIRGYRIEPGEIAASLDRFPGIEASVVSARDVGDGGPALVAYLVTSSGSAPPSPTALRSFLAARLPDYMVPAYFVALGELPMTANGKVDRSALPAPRADNLLPGNPKSNRVASSSGVPSVPNEDGALAARLSEMVALMLGQPSIGSDENFFMAGGHSMLGAQLVAQIRDTFGVKLTLRQLFMAPTVDALTAQIAQLSKTA